MQSNRRSRLVLRAASSSCLQQSPACTCRSRFFGAMTLLLCLTLYILLSRSTLSSCVSAIIRTELCKAQRARVFIYNVRHHSSGAFNLSSNQVLRVEPNATLAASTDVHDFPVVSSFASYGKSRDVANSTCRLAGGYEMSKEF